MCCDYQTDTHMYVFVWKLCLHNINNRSHFFRLSDACISDDDDVRTELSAVGSACWNYIFNVVDIFAEDCFQIPCVSQLDF